MGLLKTLNVGHNAWADNYGPPNLGTIGVRASSFEQSLQLARVHSFDAVNLHSEALLYHSPAEIRSMLEAHGQRPGAFCLPFRLTDECNEKQFEDDLETFTENAPRFAAAGYRVCAHHLLPWSQPPIGGGDALPFHAHFRLVARRLARIVPVLEAHGLRAGLEPIGAFGLRRVQERDFVHTIEGVRSLIAAAGAEGCVGLKLDAFHWWASGCGLDELVKLDASEIVYVELSDGVEPAGRWNRLSVPELHRELPGVSGNLIDTPGVLATLSHIGFDGHVVAEPYSRRLQQLSTNEAVAQVSASLDNVLEQAQRVKLPPELIGTHPYLDEPPGLVKPLNGCKQKS